MKATYTFYTFSIIPMLTLETNSYFFTLKIHSIWKKSTSTQATLDVLQNLRSKVTNKDMFPKEVPINSQSRLSSFQICCKSIVRVRQCHGSFFLLYFIFLSFFFTFFLYSFSVIYNFYSFDGLRIRTPHPALRTPHSRPQSPLFL